MGETTGIEWTDSTVSFWWGCRKVGPGCDRCYAEAWARRFGIPDYESSGVRRKVKGAVATIRKLQRGAAKFYAEHGRRRRVFIQSMSDFFDNEVSAEWRAEAWAEIVAADQLDIQLVTKRLPNVEKFVVAQEGGHLRWPSHVGLIATMVNQDEVNRDVVRLVALKRRLNIPWVGLSIEPMVGPIDLTRIPMTSEKVPQGRYNGLTGSLFSDERAQRVFSEVSKDGRPVSRVGIDWVIVGGESGRDARPIHPAWVRAIRNACAAAGVPFLWKQWGEWSPAPQIIDAKGPSFHRFEDGTWVQRVGKKAAGRMLDGRTHDQWPEAA